jgi:hypothetical protein
MVAKSTLHYPLDYQILICGVEHGLDIMVCAETLIYSLKYGVYTNTSDAQK